MYRRVNRFNKTKSGRRLGKVAKFALTSAAMYYAPGLVARGAFRKVLGGRILGGAVRKTPRYVSVDPWSKHYIEEYSKRRFGKYY